jgi:hypothetical protein
MTVRHVRSLLVPVLAALALAVPSAADHRHGGDRDRDGGAEAHDMKLLGFHNLQGRSAYQPIVHQQGRRFIAYIGHHGGTHFNPMTGVDEPNGTSIVDITDPRRPSYLFHIPGEAGAGEAGGAQMVRACNGRDLAAVPGSLADPGKVYLLRTFGNSAHQIYDVTNPAAPVFVTNVSSGLAGTHKSFWECTTGIAYLVSGVPGWRTNRMTEIYDLKTPSAPVKIRDYGLHGQQPGATGPVPTSLHGPISVVEKNRVYFGHGTNANGIVQIVDRAKLLTGPPAPTEENLKFPLVAQVELSPFNGAHTTFPVLGVPMPPDDLGAFTVGAVRDFLAVVNESLRDTTCVGEVHQMVYFMDITNETRPQIASNFHVPEASGRPGFCSRGGRFGAHSSNENMTPLYYRKVLFVAYFNAGVRAIDMRSPFSPREIAYFIPRTTRDTQPRPVGCTVGVTPGCTIVIQTNNVDVDDRGVIVIVDRANTGMHVLELTGDARKLMTD